MYMTDRNTYCNYIQYLKLKNTTKICAPTRREYDRRYNRALALSDDVAPGAKDKAMDIAKELYKIKRDPDVLAIIQKLLADGIINPDC